MSTPDDPVVLIVEDEDEMAEAHRRYLEDDYRTRIARDGEDALSKLDESIEVVLLDRRMPGLSGEAVLSSIRDRGLECRVAMVTAVEPDVDIVEMGFDAYLTKPVSETAIRRTVEQLLERSSYDSLLQEYYSSVEKLATLEATMTKAELEQSEEYQELSEEVESARQDLRQTLDGIEDDDDFVTTIRQLNDR